MFSSPDTAEELRRRTREVWFHALGRFADVCLNHVLLMHRLGAAWSGDGEFGCSALTRALVTKKVPTTLCVCVCCVSREAYIF